MTPEIKWRIEQIRRGEVPEGYQKKSVGIIPQSWDMSFLGTIIKELSTGVSVNSDAAIDTGVNVLKTSSISGGKVDLRESKPIVLRDLMRVKCPVLQGTILISRMNTPILVGECGYVSEGSNVHYLPDRLWQATNKSEKVCNFKWLNYLLNSDRYRTAIHALGTGTSNSMKNISKEDFLALPIAFPTLPEQQKIAAILTTQDKVIELKEKRLAEKQRQKKYLMQQLLTGKKRLPGFSGEWKKTKLKNILHERKTYSPKGLNYPHVTLSTEGIFPKSERYDRDHLVRDEDKEYKITHKGDICYNPANLKFGAICENTFGDAIFSPIYVTFEVRKNVCREYLANYLMRWDFINAVRKYEEGTVYERMAVKPEDFLKFEIFLPQIEEQTAIAEVLTAADREIDLLRQEIEQEKQKKKALMQLLLTGIVRVNV